MEESARRHEASLSFRYGQAPGISESPEITLPERLRALLLSRNKKRPPSTPCPTTDYRYHSLQPVHAAIGNSLAPPRTHSFSATRTTANQEALENLNRTMGATRFDGPAGQILERNHGQSRRQSTDTRMPSDRISLTEDQPISSMSGLDHKSHGDLIGSRLLTLDALTDAESKRSKRPTQSTTPRISYTLRTVPPKTPKKTDQRMSSVGQSQPRYSSEADAQARSLPLEDVPKETHVHHGPSSNAVDALHHIQDHDLRSTPNAKTPSPRLIENDGPTSNLAIPEHLTTKPVVKDETPRAKLTDSKPSHAEIADVLTKLPSIPVRESSVVSGQSFSPDPEEDDQTPETSLLPSTDKDDEMRQHSPISRALSVVSNMSSISALRSLRRHSTLRNYRIPETDTKEYQNIHQSPLLVKDSGALWPQRIGEKRSKASLEHSNLTTRPSQRADVIPDKVHSKIVDTESTDEASILGKQERTKESFQKVIGDLESLLNEALHIASRTSSKESETSATLPPAKGNGYRRLSLQNSDVASVHSSDSDKNEFPQGHVVITEPERDHQYQIHFKKAHDATPFPRSLAITRQHSIVPSLNAEDPESDQGTPVQSTDVLPTTQRTLLPEPFAPVDWAAVQRPASKSNELPAVPVSLQVPNEDQQHHLVRNRHQTSKTALEDAPSIRQRPPVQPRGSSLNVGQRPRRKQAERSKSRVKSSYDSISTSGPYVSDFRNTAVTYHPVYREVPTIEERTSKAAAQDGGDDFALFPQQRPQEEGQAHSHPTRDEIRKGYSLKGLHHFEIHEPHGFSLSRSHRRAPIARDWGNFRKRFVATVTCINTTFLGLIIGIYAGEVPAIQYALADDHHIVILGNVVFFLGLAITTVLFWPLPLLHGRRPYTTAALTLLLLLLLPQALAINGSRSPYVATYRVGLLVPRAFAGLVMGFANINFKTTLLDLFGSSLQSGNPHQEVVVEHDVRRHGGGMGVWLGIWVWCSVGSIGVGFWIGASIISGLQVSWGFWILIILTAAVLFLNVLTPETRRSPYRRSMAEVRDGTDISRRIARGEIKMHLDSTGPIWWWEEVWSGHVLCIRMFKQIGFSILSLYIAWIYGQVVLVIVLLGALLSKYYFFHSQYVGLSIAIIPLGALLATPFQKASLFSRSRHHKQRTDSMTFEKRVTWTSHLVRRAIFMVILPFAGLAYTLASRGPPVHFMVPIIFAGVIGFLSNLAIAECNGIVMETFDTSDLQPGMTGRPRNVLPEEIRKKRTNFSSFPRVTAGFANIHALSFCIAAAVTGWGGVLERRLGAQTATAIMAGVLLLLTLLLIAALTRYKTVQIIPSQRFGTTVLSGPEDEWKPVIIGNPSGTTRRISLLEQGALSRWTEIRRRNRLSTEK